jgi:hypothetical protein
MTAGLYDARFERLDRLARPAPDAARGERTRLRCRAHLGRRQRRAVWAVSTVGRARRVIAPVVVGGFCVLCAFYVSALLATTLRLRGVLH